MGCVCVFFSAVLIDIWIVFESLCNDLGMFWDRFEIGLESMCDRLGIALRSLRDNLLGLFYYSYPPIRRVSSKGV